MEIAKCLKSEKSGLATQVREGYAGKRGIHLGSVQTHLGWQHVKIRKFGQEWPGYFRDWMKNNPVQALICP